MTARALRRLVAIAAGLVASIAAADFFSPGDLSKAHQSLEGLSQCTACHEAGEKLSETKCLACHGEVKRQVDKSTGFHGRIPAKDRSCESCHGEHQGREANIVWGERGKSGFNHAKSTGFSLEGKHERVSCESCHSPKLVVDKEVRALLAKHPERRTFLGLSTRCDACHFDEHRGQLGKECGSCHNAKSWAPAPGFDHSRTDFDLKGKHRKVECSACHPSTEVAAPPQGTFPAPRSATHFLKFGEVPHAACTDCHKDPHQGRFGERCQSCHTEESWHTVRDAAKERAFHDKTRYPLRGAHVEVACRSCHGPFPGRPARFKGLEFDRCESCHIDAHLGQMTRGKRSSGCAACHTVDAFRPARFSPEDHQQTQFPLEGGHRIVACTSCHRLDPTLEQRVPPAVRTNLSRQKRPLLVSLRVFDAPPKGTARCDACHKDVHGGQLSTKPCESCHRVESFHALRFDHDRDTRYPLTGKHAQVGCNGCHTAPVIGGRVTYKPIETRCGSCHADVHAGQFAAQRGAATECERCHTTDAFKSTRFVHRPPFTSFVLEGKHASTECTACHPAVKVAAGESATKYRGVPQTCAGCHADPHHGAFEGFAP